MPKWIKDWIGPCLLGLLVFSILLAVAGFMASYDGRRKLAAFGSDGRTVVATITGKDARDANQEYWTQTFSGRGDQVSQVSVCFRMADNGYYCGTTEVPNRLYDAVRVGSPLRVTYVPSHPDWFYVGDDVPIDHDSDVFGRMFQFCSVTSLLLIIAIAMMVFWPNDGVGGHASGGSLANDVASSFRQRHGFGRHN